MDASVPVENHLWPSRTQGPKEKPSASVEVDCGGEGEKLVVVSVGVKSLPPPFSVIHNPDVHAIVGSEEVSRSVIGILDEFASSSINPLPAKVGEEKFAYPV